VAVGIPHEPLSKSPAEIVQAAGGRAHPAAGLPEALRMAAAALPEGGRILVCGSLYLAGRVLAENGTARMAA